MGMTNAERQRAYRQRHLSEGEAHRLSLIVSVQAGAQLARLAKRYGVTKRVMLERLLRQAESELVDGMQAAERRDYFDGQG